MEHIGKSKISKLHSKPTILYPQIHLPQEYSSLIGKTAHLFDLGDKDGTEAFLMVVLQTEAIDSQAQQRVSKLESEVSKLLYVDILNKHLLELESEIKE